MRRSGLSRTPLLRRIGCSALAVTLALGLTPTAAFADNVPSSESAVAGLFDPEPQAPGAAYDFEEGYTLAVAREDMPVSYDLRDEGYVTPVKFQNPWGACWGFAAVAAVESSILSEMGLTYEETEFDLSEKHLAWFAKTGLPEDEQNYPNQAGEGYHYIAEGNPSQKLATGATAFTATSIFSSGIGPVFEENAPYHGANETIQYYTYGEHQIPFCYSQDDDWSVSEDLRFVQAYELEESEVLPSPNRLEYTGTYDSDGNPYMRSAERNEQANLAIKQELLAGRAVMISYASDQSRGDHVVDPDHHFINGTTYAQYTHGEFQLNHGVTIIGYDDEYEVSNFIEGSEPPGPGAWIVKNSWGSSEEPFPNNGITGWGADGGTGYFYLSYYDESISTPESFNFKVDQTDENSAYYIASQHDLMPSAGVFSTTSPNEARMANVFPVGETMNLRAVSVESSTPGTEASIEIYVLEEGHNGPTDGKLVATLNKTFAYGGYHRINLDQPIELRAGQDFSVVVTLRTPSGQYEVIVDRVQNNPNSTTVVTGVVNKGESYSFSDGVWTDWADSIESEAAANPALANFEYDNFPIKAYSNPAGTMYSDVNLEDWYYHPVRYISSREIMTGYEDTDLFGALDNMQRQDIACMLFKWLAPEEEALYADGGYEAVADTTGLTDAQDGQYYTPAVNWAYEQGYLTGYADRNELGVGCPITREEFATVLYRISGQEGAGVIAGDWADIADVSDWAEIPMAWATGAGIIQGSDGLLLPQNATLRAEIATMLTRYLEP